MEYNTQLSKKLIQYTKVGKKNTLTEISASLESPFPTELSKSWSQNVSLYKRLEELKKEFEVSRDDGREQHELAVYQPVLQHLVTQDRLQPDRLPLLPHQNISTDAPTTPKSVCQYSQTEEQSTIPTT